MRVSRSARDAPEAFGTPLPSGLERSNLERARKYLAAVEGEGDPFAFLAPDVVQIEYPNRFTPKTAERDLAAMKEAWDRGKHAMRAQRYEVVNAMANASEVALEVIWVGVLGMQVGSLGPGEEMSAHFGVFLTFRDGLITRQRNYDCFDPF